MGHRHYHHGGFGHRHHRGFSHVDHHMQHHHSCGHRGFRHHHGFGPNPAMLAEGTIAAGAIAGVLAGSVTARPSARRPFARPPQNAGAAHVLTPLPQMPLGVLSIRIPPEAMERRGRIQYFAIDVLPDNGQAPWRVMRRYNQFHDLAKKLGFENVPASFPRKHLTGCEGIKLQRRRQALEFWLSQVIACLACGKFQHWIAALRSFLEAPANVIAGLQSLAPTAGAPVTSQAHAAHADSVNPAAAAQLSPAATGPFEISTTRNPQVSQVSMLMEIDVPSNVIAGQLLNVTLPSGQQFLCKIPDGVLSGHILKFWHDPEQGSLEPLI